MAAVGDGGEEGVGAIEGGAEGGRVAGVASENGTEYRAKIVVSNLDPRPASFRLEERVPVYASGLGDPGPWMERMRANGTKVMAVVPNVITPGVLQT